MYTGKYVFSQVSFFLPARIFDRCVALYNGNRYVKHFTCRNQLLCMVFGQLCGRDSLRDLIVGINPHADKFYHLGFEKNVTRSNLSLANEQRDYKIFKEFAYTRVIAEYAVRFQDILPEFHLPTESLQMLKIQLSQRERIVDMKRQAPHH